MKRLLPAALLILAIAGNLVLAKNPPRQPVTDVAAKPAPPLAKSATRFRSAKVRASNVATAMKSKPNDPGYTQVGAMIKLKLDRQKTELRLYEDAEYTLLLNRDDIRIVGGSNSRLLEIQVTDNNSVIVHTKQAGLVSLTFLDKSQKDYVVELTIVGDTRTLQGQLEALYPQALIQAIKVRDSVLIRGTVLKPEHVEEIIEIAEQFYPTVLNQLRVGVPVQQQPQTQFQPQPKIQLRSQPRTYAQPQRHRYPQPQYQSQPRRQVQPQPAPSYAPQRQPSRETSFANPLHLGELPVARPATPVKQQIMLEAHVLEIDWKKLAETKIDLVQIVRAFAADPKPRDPSKPNDSRPAFLIVDVPSNTQDGIVRLLSATKAVQLISHPQLVTFSGQQAEVLIGSEIPIMARNEIRNGKESMRIEFRNIGTTIKLTPQPLSNGKLNLTIVVEHSQRIGTVASQITGFAVPRIRTHKFDAKVELDKGHSIILTETGPIALKNEKQTAGKGLMIVITPSLVAPSSRPAPVSSRPRTAQSTQPIDVLRQGAGIRPVKPIVFKAASPKQSDLRESVNELRREVRALSKDVGRLLKALEKKEKTWNEVRQLRVSPNERHILAELEKDVSLKIKDVALTDVLQDLSKTRGLNVVLDSTGLAEEGITEKTPISFNVTDVKLKNVLKLILEPMQLTYQVRDDVIVITSKFRAQGKLVVTTYPVADLVIPIPTTSPDRADQIAPAGRKNDHKALKSEPLDFETLIATILTTIQPDSWDENGGPASMRAFKPNLSLVIRQTQQAHEEIADLLEQLRQLQDMQVTLESRLLDNLPDRFFERLGVDFDFKRGGNQALVSGILTDRQVDVLLQATQEDERANLTELPKVTLFNGQDLGIDSFFVGNKQHPLKLSLHMQPVISADRRHVRLNLRTSDPKSPSTKSQHFVNKIPDGQAFLIEIGRGNTTAVGVPVHTKTPSADRLFTRVRRTNGRRFLLIRPRIVMQEEEEELLGISLEN